MAQTTSVSSAALRSSAMLADRPFAAAALARPDLILQPPGSRPATPPAQPAPPPAAPTAPAAAAPVAVPPAPVATPTPFDQLPYPAPGDRIRADDFRHLSDCLAQIRDAHRLANALTGTPLGQARAVLAAGGWTVARVVGVFGNLLDDPNSPALDDRLVLFATPAVLGERRVLVVVSEPVATTRLTPNLIGRTYADARALMSATLGDAVLNGGPVAAPRLIGLTLEQAGAARQ